MTFHLPTDYMVAAGIVTTSPGNISWQHLLVLGAGSHAATTSPGNISWYLVLVPMVLVPMLLQHLLVLDIGSHGASSHAATTSPGT